MKAGYKVDRILFKSDMFIEVVNYPEDNEVFIIGWKDYDGYLKSRNENTVGVWIIKNKCN